MKRICINQKNYKPQLFEQFKINFDLTATSSVLNECASVLSRVQLFATSWTVARQAFLSMEFSQARILEWVAISYSGGSSLPKYQTFISCVSCISSGFFFLLLHHIYIGVFQLSISGNSRYISSVFHLLERWEEGRQCWQTAKQLLDYLDGYAVNLLCYFPLVLIVVLNSLKTEKKFLYFTIELTAQLEEKYCWNLSMNVANLCCIYRQGEN